MMILAIEDRYFDRQARQSLRGRKTAKASANNDNPRFQRNVHSVL